MIRSGFHLSRPIHLSPQNSADDVRPPQRRSGGAWFDEFHLWQELLSQTFRPPTHPPELVASDLNLYYDPLNTSWYKRTGLQ